MLHELLLSLTGHPSPLLASPGDAPSAASSISELISPSELSLLRRLAHLQSQQAQILVYCATLASSQRATRSTIGPAIAAQVREGPIAALQRHVRDVEQRILAKDAGLVGAYRSVPLAGLVGEFDGWERVLEWICMALGFAAGDLQVPGKDDRSNHVQSSTEEPPSGVRVLDYLSAESRTGYPEIEIECRAMLKAGQAAWMRQLAAWLLYGKLSDIGWDDFFIHQQSGQFVLRRERIPNFVTPATAASILFIGRSLHQVQEHLIREPDAGIQLDINTLRTGHLHQLSSVAIPIVPAALARTMAAIRISLARNALQKLLPISSIQHVLKVLREFFLLERGEFPMLLISTTDAHLAGRTAPSGAAAQHDHRLLGGAMVKEAELSSIMAKTWSSLASLQPVLPDWADETEDSTLDSARDNIRLTLRKPHSRPTAPSEENPTLIPAAGAHVFDDLLIGVPTALDMTIASPLDMFLNTSELAAYSHLHAYLIALHRGLGHLTGLTALSALRRTPGALARVPAARPRLAARNSRLRSLWATTARATHLLTELRAHVHDDVLAPAWAALDAWLKPSAAPSAGSDIAASPQDPATLRRAHRAFLRALAPALQLHDPPYVRALRALLVHAAHLAGLVGRLDVVVRGVEAAHAAGPGEGSQSEVPPHLADEEARLLDTIDAGVTQVRSSTDEVVTRLRALDAVGMPMEPAAAGFLSTAATDAATNVNSDAFEAAGAGEGEDFVPWRGFGIGRLLMRLETGAEA